MLKKRKNKGQAKQELSNLTFIIIPYYI